MKLEWRIISNSVAYVLHGERALVLAIVDGGTKFGATAFETQNPIGKKPGLKVVGEFFDDHAHDVIGEFKTDTDARKACEKYASAWKRRKKIEACKCGPIARKKRRA